MLIALPRQTGTAVLACVSVLLTMTTAACMTALHVLAAGRIVVSHHLDRQIAFRAAEVALLDAEADVIAALSAGNPRMASWPAAGATPAPWQPWLDGDPDALTSASTFGAFTGARMPVLPAGVAGATVPPRYLVEILNDGVPGERPRFRVTSLGIGRDRAVQVMLQTEFQP